MDLVCRKQLVERSAIELLHRVFVAVDVDQFTVMRLIIDGKSNQLFEGSHWE